jgi:NADH-quinone oxidoreductase subunit N
MIPSADYIRILPEVILSVFGVIVMLIEATLDDRNDRRSLGASAFVGVLASIAATVFQYHYQGSAFSGVVRVDGFSIFFHFVVGIVSLLVILGSIEYLAVQGIRAGEYYGLILFGTVGMMLMSSAVELVLVFISLEISSISTYILAGFRRRTATSIEASLKYFLLGSFATAFFLYGVAMMFGATGTTNVYEIGAKLGGGTSTLAYVAMALMFVGLGFKVATAPFHVWTPDVYEGAPSPVVALMSTGPKAATFAVMLRIFFAAVPGAQPQWFWLVWVSAVLSMFLGNIGALVQTSIKRMLAYSSIAHAGYLLIAFAANPDFGISAAMFYAASYAVMNSGAFLVISHFGSLRERYVTLEDYAGLGRRQPLLAATLTIFLLSLIGIPITGGFLAKFYVFTAALKANLVGLVILGVINSAIAAYYYLRVIVYMYMREPREGLEPVPATRIPLSLGVSLALSVIAVIYLGVLPGNVIDFAISSAQQMLR